MLSYFWHRQIRGTLVPVECSFARKAKNPASSTPASQPQLWNRDEIIQHKSNRFTCSQHFTESNDGSAMPQRSTEQCCSSQGWNFSLFFPALCITTIIWAHILKKSKNNWFCGHFFYVTHSRKRLKTLQGFGFLQLQRKQINAPPNGQRWHCMLNLFWQIKSL